MASLSEQLLELEKKLLDPALRRNPEKLAPMLAEEFVEFASSGRAYDKNQVLYKLRKQVPGQLAIEEFRAIEVTSSCSGEVSCPSGVRRSNTQIFSAQLGLD